MCYIFAVGSPAPRITVLSEPDRMEEQVNIDGQAVCDL